MKSMLLAIGLLAGTQAFAAGKAKDCTPYVANGGGESGIVEWVYPCGMNYPVKHATCREGEIAYTSVFNGEGYTEMPIVCRNGTFAGPTPRVKHRGCIEGEIAYTSEYSGEGYMQVPIVCKNGKFRKLN